MFFAVSGPVTEENVVHLGSVIRQTCAEAAVRGAIVDCADMQGALTTGKLYYATQKFMQEVGAGISVAYINPPLDWIPEDDQFSRDVAYNRGGALELFSTETEAAAWIHEQQQ